MAYHYHSRSTHPFSMHSLMPSLPTFPPPPPHLFSARIPHRSFTSPLVLVDPSETSFPPPDST